MGLTWINRVGVVTLVLGVAFFFKYAVEAGWIGEWARVLLGAAAGLAAVAVGERTWRGGQQVWAQGVSAAGIGILYSRCLCRLRPVRLVPQGAAFLLLAVVTAGRRSAGAALRRAGARGARPGRRVTPRRWRSAPAPGNPGSCWATCCCWTPALYVARARRWQALEALALAGTVWLYGTVANRQARAPRRRYPIPPGVLRAVRQRAAAVDLRPGAVARGVRAGRNLARRAGGVLPARCRSRRGRAGRCRPPRLAARPAGRVLVRLLRLARRSRGRAGRGRLLARHARLRRALRMGRRGASGSAARARACRTCCWWLSTPGIYFAVGYALLPAGYAGRVRRAAGRRPHGVRLARL